MQDSVDWPINLQRLAHVPLVKLESCVSSQMLDVPHSAGDQIVKREDVVAFEVSRVREMLALTTLDYSTKARPTLRTSLPNVFVANSAQIVNGTLNVNETVGLANAAAASKPDCACGAPPVR